MIVEGQRLGEFEIIERIGQGGMGAVYKARQTSLDRLVALKTLQGPLAEDAEYIARFRQEARAAAGLHHSNLVQVYSAGENEGLHWFAMEYIEGESAKDRLQRKGRLKPLEAIAIVIHAAAALEYGWNKAALIHRDVKPDNIFLSDEGEVRLGDLGLAKSIGQAQHLTTTGVSMGTPYYISPEQVEGTKNIDFRADIYSLGGTLYHLLSGHPPYEGGNAVGIMMKHVNEPAPDVRSVWPECPAELAMVVMKMMLKAPESRPQSYAELTAQLRRVYDLLSAPDGPTGTTAAPLAVVGAAGGGTVSPRTGPYHAGTDAPAHPQVTGPAKTRKSKAPLFAGLAAIVVALAVGAYYFVQALSHKAAGKFGTPDPAGDGGGTRSVVSQPPPGGSAPLAAATKGSQESQPAVSPTIDPRFGGTWKGQIDPGTGVAPGSPVTFTMAPDGKSFDVDTIIMEGGKFNSIKLRIGPFKNSPISGNTISGGDFELTVEPNATSGHFKLMQSNYGPAFSETRKLGEGTLTRIAEATTPAPRYQPPPPALSSAHSSSPATAGKDAPFINSLGMKFVPAGTPDVLFCVWDTRVKDFAEFIQQSGYDMSKGKAAATLGNPAGVWMNSGGSWLDPHFPKDAAQTADHPVVCVSWEDAQAFCAWLGKKEGRTYRLPKDHEWSAAAGIAGQEDASASPESKAGKIKGVYAWGTQWPPPAGAGNFAGEESSRDAARNITWPVISGYNDGFVRTSPVGTFAPNDFGLYDMAGNVWQWCEDWYNSKHEVPGLRGSAWTAGDQISLQSSSRMSRRPSDRWDTVGFRAVLVVSGH